jgi:hypothetical protein
MAASKDASSRTWRWLALSNQRGTKAALLDHVPNCKDSKQRMLKSIRLHAMTIDVPNGCNGPYLAINVKKLIGGCGFVSQVLHGAEHI